MLYHSDGGLNYLHSVFDICAIYILLAQSTHDDIITYI